MIVVEHGEMDETGDSVQCALYLAQAGETVRLAGPGTLTASQGRALEVAGVRVASSVHFEGADEVWWDVWTSEADSRVMEARSLGVRTSCLADYLLETRRERIVAITGTAGKTTTSWLTAQLLGWLRTVSSSQARAGNLWPTASLLETAREAQLVLELTSSHLAFCNQSPRVAAITNYWPDHIELHGSEEAYRLAKTRIFAKQRASDLAVLPYDDPIAASLADGSPAVRCWFAEGVEPPAGAVRVWSLGESLCLELGQQSLQLRLPSQFASGVRRRALVCALATTLAAVSGSPIYLEPLEVALATLQLPPHRGSLTGDLLDDSLAATPRKARASLFSGAHVVVGGMLFVAGRQVHSSSQEVAELDAWINDLERLAGGVYLFGPAGEWLSTRLRGAVYPDVISAVRAAQAFGSVLVSPGFPMAQTDRVAVAQLGLAGDA